MPLLEGDFTRTDPTSGAKCGDDEGSAAFQRLRNADFDIEIMSPSPGGRDAFTRCGGALVHDASHIGRHRTDRDLIEAISFGLGTPTFSPTNDHDGPRKTGFDASFGPHAPPCLH